MSTMPWGRPLTLEDFEEIRDVDDGHRYELIDGALIVTPSPAPVHQLAAAEIFLLLHHSAPAGLRALFAPLDIRLGPDTVVQPDILVATTDSITDRRIEGPPVLAVEVLSPSTRHFDLGLKLSRYEAAGCPNYWVIDPAEPSLRAWHLSDEGYHLVAHATGAEVADLAHPWPLRITPDAPTRA